MVEGLCGGFGGGREWRGEGREGGVVVWVGWLVGVEGRKGMVGGKLRGGLLDGLLVSRSFSMIYIFMVDTQNYRVGGWIGFRRLGEGFFCCYEPTFFVGLWGYLHISCLSTSTKSISTKFHSTCRAMPHCPALLSALPLPYLEMD